MVIFAFSPENPLEVIFAPVYMLINIVRNLTCLHAYILNGRHYFHVLLFSRVVIFAFFLGAKITTERKLMSIRYLNKSLHHHATCQALQVKTVKKLAKIGDQSI